MLRELTKLATENSRAKRLELMNIISDMFINTSQKTSPTELELFGDVFTKLLDDMDDNSKVDISTKFAHVSKTPKTFAIALIYEKAEVAAPMLEFSPVFDDDDLVNATNLTTTEHRVAIAKRENVSSLVTDTLIGLGETIVLRTVVQNFSARISSRGFSHMVKFSPEDGELLSILLQRDDLPKDIKTLLPHLAGGVLKKIVKVADKHSKKEMDELIEKTHKTREAQQQIKDLDTTSTMEEVNQVRAGELDVDEAVLAFAEGNLHDKLAIFISEIEHLDAQYVKQILTQTNGEPITILCRAMELTAPTFKQVCTMRERALTLPLLAKAKVIKQFKDLSVKEAKEALRKVKLQHAVKAQQQ